MYKRQIEKSLEGKQLALRKKVWIISGVVGVVGLGSVLLAGNVIEAKEPAPKVFLKTEDKDVNKFEAKITATKDNGDGTVTYKVEAQGYASTEDASKFNKFDIVVNTKDCLLYTSIPKIGVT